MLLKSFVQETVRGQAYHVLVESLMLWKFKFDARRRLEMASVERQNTSK